MYQHSGGEPITVESFHKSSSHRQIHAVYFVIPIKTKGFTAPVFFLSFFFLFLVFFRKQKLTVDYARFMAFSPFLSAFTYTCKNLYIYIHGKIKLHTP